MSDLRQRILIVDDERFNINVLVDLLRADYKISVAKNGEQALQRTLADPPPDLVLLDIIMPGLDGYEVCRRLKADDRTRDIPIIFVTAMGDVHDETRGLEIGAVDYITKPISPPIVKARVKTHLTLRRAREFLKHQNQILETMVGERTHELALTQDVTILCMASLAETRDQETGFHIRRTQHYIRALCEKLASNSKFKAFLTDEVIELLFKSAPLHDIGKVGVPDSILKKRGPLTPSEIKTMERHAIFGRDAILLAEKQLGSTSFLRFAREITHSHHEKWDGSGYPEGLRGPEIPISGRLMALADVYDALISKRVYKDAFPHEEASRIIINNRGTHFDPDMVDAFVEIGDSFQKIANDFAG